MTKVYKSPMPELSLKYKSGNIHKMKVSSSQDIYDFVKYMYDADTVEYNEAVIAIFLNGANNTIGWIKHSSGGTAHAIIDIKMLLSTALLCGAVAIVLSHNHPSGQIHPSTEDDRITQKVKAGCDAIGLRLLDHVIVPGDFSNGRYYSFCDEGKI